MLIQNLKYGPYFCSWLQGSVWNYIKTCSVICCVKIYGFCGTLNGSFLHRKFSNSVHCSGRKYWLSKLCRSFKWWHISLYDIKKELLLLMSSLISSENSLSIGNLSRSWWQMQFVLNLKFCLRLPTPASAVHTFHGLLKGIDSLSVGICWKDLSSLVIMVVMVVAHALNPSTQMAGAGRW